MRLSADHKVGTPLVLLMYDPEEFYEKDEYDKTSSYRPNLRY
jgi:hypothetical protein